MVTPSRLGDLGREVDVVADDLAAFAEENGGDVSAVADQSLPRALMSSSLSAAAKPVNRVEWRR